MTSFALQKAWLHDDRELMPPCAAGSEEVKAALGESWKVQANMHIMLSCMGPALRKATMAANTLGPCGAAAYYELSEGGPIAVDAPG